ncbi:hypothetical protein FIBSPDRAFT_864092 [Athelia psychrophila]|uniref:Uncharacterized protein n=1 Tax=Athelia psychrophila TaxID=1759441 RepID=A0A166GTW1_9AGAM|nr:hypothetical protein FIBSPDRAFT_864092 [Fibularhizoctonia sp. CBS 109695]
MVEKDNKLFEFLRVVLIGSGSGLDVCLWLLLMDHCDSLTLPRQSSQSLAPRNSQIPT